MGNYVAEGCSTKGRIIWYSNRKEINIRKRLISCLITLGLKPRQRNTITASKVEVNSKQLEKKFKEWFGVKTGNKKIPDFILYNSNENILISFLNGLQEGDGHIRINPYNGRKQYILSTISKRLALQTQIGYARLGIPASISINKHEGKRKIEGREVYIHDIYRIHHQKEINSYWRHFVDKDAIYFGVTSIEKIPYHGIVYNLSTGDETYIISNAVVHNCGWLKHRTEKSWIEGKKSTEDFEPDEHGGDAAYQKGIEQEQKEHPTLSQESVKKIVQDHLKENQNYYTEGENKVKESEEEKLDKEETEARLNAIRNGFSPVGIIKLKSIDKKLNKALNIVKLRQINKKLGLINKILDLRKDKKKALYKIIELPKGMGKVLEAEFPDGTRAITQLKSKGIEKKEHSKKWHRCVENVKRARGAESPEAVCTAALEDESYA